MAKVQVFDSVKSTDLWKHFDSVADNEKSNMVTKLVNYAIPLLDRVIETFPTYTSHNLPHQLNVLNLIGELLGERIQELSDLESAFLILSAFYHDIGMVFSKEERENLRNEKDFEVFLKKFPAAKLANETSELTEEVAEWYCRWNHANRVWVFLDKYKDEIFWENVNIRKELGEICLSHNQDIECLRDSMFETEFWGSADLRFCSIILRLADILDFDDSRASESVYEFLNLDKAKSKSGIFSSREFQKNLASKGFSFEKWNPNTPYEISFKASPTDNTVEHDIRKFLKRVELELNKCSTIIKFCSDKWNTFILPYKISKNDIRSQGYKYGNYKFTLDQTQIIQLLMGENLYSDRFTFIRELLQNSIDTSRHREFHEQVTGNKDFQVEPIEVSSWLDSEGFRWFRIDDFGMGMNENTIENYFLRVGNSFYNSDEFKISKLEYQNKISEDFTPISRFGIGILSCFLECDQVEVNTHSIESDKKNIQPIRLSLKGLHNYYILQTNRDHPTPMPCEHGTEQGYRKNAGTTIAVKFKASSDLIDFNLKRILSRYLINPPVKVILKNEGVVSNYPEIVNKDLCIIHNKKLSLDKKKQIKKFLRLNKLSDINFQILPLNLSEASPSDNLKGRAVIILLNNIKGKSKYINVRSRNVIIRKKDSWNFYYQSRNYFGEDKIDLSLRIGNDLLGDKSILIDVTNLLDNIPIFSSCIPFDYPHNNLIIYHNGISIPNRLMLFHKYESSIELKIPCENYLAVFAFGVIQLKDNLRPDLNISRNQITGVSWKLLSQLNYTIRKALQQANKNDISQGHINFVRTNNIRKSEYVLKDILEDQLITDKRFWANENIFESDEKWISINQIVQNPKETIINLSNIYQEMEVLNCSALLQIHCNLKIRLYKEDYYENLPVKKVFVASRIVNQSDHPDLSYFPPLTFIEYENFSGIHPNKMRENHLNIQHPFSVWLIKSQKILFCEYPTYFWALLRTADISKLNQLLIRLKQILPQRYKPPKNLMISKSDFEVDVTALLNK